MLILNARYTSECLKTPLLAETAELWKTGGNAHAQNNLEEARTQIDAIAWYINDQIKEHEHNLMMIYIQKSLQGRAGHHLVAGRVPDPYSFVYRSGSSILKWICLQANTIDQDLKKEFFELAFFVFCLILNNMDLLSKKCLSSFHLKTEIGIFHVFSITFFQN